MIIHLEDGKGPVRLLSGQDGAEILDLVVLWMQLTSQGSYLLVSDSTLVLTPTSRLIPWFSTQLHEHRTVSYRAAMVLTSFLSQALAQLSALTLGIL